MWREACLLFHFTPVIGTFQSGLRRMVSQLFHCAKSERFCRSLCIASYSDCRQARKPRVGIRPGIFRQVGGGYRLHQPARANVPST